MMTDNDREMPTMATATTRRDELHAMRGILARRIDSGTLSARDLSPIVRQLREVSRESEELQAAQDAAAQAAPATDEAPF